MMLDEKMQMQMPDETQRVARVKDRVEHIVMCGWERLDKNPPSVCGEYYLFSGYDPYGNFVFDKYYYSFDGKINGWNVESAIKNGNTWWCLPNEPSDTERPK